MQDLTALFRNQKAAQPQGGPPLAARIAALTALRMAILRHQPQIVAALAADFAKPEAEVILSEILPVLQEIAHARRWRCWALWGG